MAARHMKQKSRRGNAGRHSLTPNYPVWLSITLEVLHYFTMNCTYIVCMSISFVFIKLKKMLEILMLFVNAISALFLYFFISWIRAQSTRFHGISEE